MDYRMPTMITTDVPSSVKVEITVGHRKSDAEPHVLVSLTNTGAEAAKAQFTMMPSAGQEFHPCYLGITGTAPFDWDQVATGNPQHWGFVVTGIRPGQTARIELGLRDLNVASAA